MMIIGRLQRTLHIDIGASSMDAFYRILVALQAFSFGYEI